VGVVAYVLVVSVPALAAGLLADLVINRKRGGERSRLLHSIVFAPIVGMTVGAGTAAALSTLFSIVQAVAPLAIPPFVATFLPPLLTATAAGALAGTIGALSHLFIDSLTIEKIYIPFGKKTTAPKTSPPPTPPSLHVSRLRRILVPLTLWVSRLCRRLAPIRAKVSLEQSLRLHEWQMGDLPCDGLRTNWRLIFGGSIMLAGGILPAMQPILPFSVGPLLWGLFLLVIIYLAWLSRNFVRTHLRNMKEKWIK
jgi:hypothetical protein